MIAFIASLLGLVGVPGVSAQINSANGPSVCPLCCGRSAVAQRTDSSRERPSLRKAAAISLLRGYPLGNAGNVRTSRSSPTKGAQR